MLRSAFLHQPLLTWTLRNSHVVFLGVILPKALRNSRLQRRPKGPCEAPAGAHRECRGLALTARLALRMCGGESGNRGRGRDDREARASVRRRGMTAGKGTESCRRASQKQPAGGGGGGEAEHGDCAGRTGADTRHCHRRRQREVEASSTHRLQTPCTRI